MELIGPPLVSPAVEGILHDVRHACRAVTEEATFVRVDARRLAVLADELATAGEVPAAPDPWRVDEGPAEDRAALVLSLAAIAFGSGYHPHVRKRPGCSGATTMAYALRDWAEPARGHLTTGRLVSLTPTVAHEVFGQPPDDGPRSDLMGLFAAALNDLGNLVDEDHDGRFGALVDAAGGSAAGLVAVLDRMPFFRDRAPYRGRLVPFYKRAQLAAADLERAGVARFTDLDDLTAFADNLVPHVLRVEGVLRYDDGLVRRIDAGEPLPAGSEEEVEIRAAGVHGVELLRAALAERGLAVRASDLDARLWRRGGGPRYKAVPRHRTRSVAY
jgi:hypothetical protein